MRGEVEGRAINGRRAGGGRGGERWGYHAYVSARVFVSRLFYSGSKNRQMKGL